MKYSVYMFNIVIQVQSTPVLPMKYGVGYWEIMWFLFHLIPNIFWQDINLHFPHFTQVR